MLLWKSKCDVARSFGTVIEKNPLWLL